MLYTHYHLLFFYFNYTSPTDIYTLSLHDALPILATSRSPRRPAPKTPARRKRAPAKPTTSRAKPAARSEEHTSELQSRLHLVCRLLLEKKKKIKKINYKKVTNKDKDVKKS